MRKLFGTDGIRGTANKEPMSVDTILKVGRAAACVFRRADNHKHKVVIGKDTRLSGYMFETALASGLCSMGVDVILVGPIPTPGIAFLTSDLRADAGVMISASHNPYNDNGIKFFGPDGYKLADAVEASIEQLVNKPSALDAQRPNANEVGKAKRLEDARGRYISYLKHNFPRQYSLEGMHIVVDCAHGAAYKIAPAVYSELGATLTLMSAKPNGRNINDHCGAVYPQRMISKVKETGAHLGIAFDGDADRVAMCDEKGCLLDGDDMLAVLGESMYQQSELGTGVVGTIMSNFGLERYFEAKSIPFYRAPVGDRYVMEKMKECGAMLGGEPSGHIVCLPRSSTGDGILTSLLLLAEICRRGKPLSMFGNWIERFPQEMRNVPVRKRAVLTDVPPVSKSIRKAEKRLNGSGRVVVRYSGTEAKVRVMVEGENKDLVKELADEIASVIAAEIGVSL